MSGIYRQLNGNSWINVAFPTHCHRGHGPMSIPRADPRHRSYLWREMESALTARVIVDVSGCLVMLCELDTIGWRKTAYILHILTKQRTKNIPYSTSTAHIWRETCHISWKWDRGSLNVWIQINPSSSYFSFTSIHPYIAQGMWKCLGLFSFKRFCFSQANYIILIICPHLYIAKFSCTKRTAKITWTQFQYFIVSWLWRACCTRKKNRTNKNRPTNNGIEQQQKQNQQLTTNTKSPVIICYEYELYTQILHEWYIYQHVP